MNFSNILSGLVENISITRTEYGNIKPFSNKEFTKNSECVYTFFEHEGNIVVIEFDQNHSLNFGVLNSDNEANFLHSMKDINISNIQSFYGKILFVFGRIVDKFNMTYFKIYSNPNEKKVSKLYTKFVKNNGLQNIIKSMGFTHFEKTTQNESDLDFVIYHFSKSKITTTPTINKKK